ncbi:MAG: tetratricopeptide repeat protein [Planctomycetes bacterium]|nr:tetratricopeptide repeat protein [Planctomycetota bacterium]
MPVKKDSTQRTQPSPRRGRGGASDAALPGPAGGVLARWLPPAAILAAVLVAYHSSFAGVFLFDEDRFIVNNQAIRQLWPPGGWLRSSQRPVVELTLAINYALGGLNPWGYHAVNVGVHALAALALFGVVRRTLVRAMGPGGGGVPGARAGAGPATWLGLSVALLWAVHPLQTQSVTYVIQRGESMMGLFYLLTIYCFLRGVDARRPGGWLALAAGACAAGMGTKAVMVTAPLMVWLYDRTFVAGSFVAALRKRWGFYAALTATWGVLAACGVVRSVLSADPRPGATVGFAYKNITPLDYALTQIWAVAYYLRLAIWPHPLCLDYGWPVVRSPGVLVPCGAILAALAAGTAWGLIRRRWYGFVGAWFFVILAPTSSVIPIRDTIFEHRMYLPLAAIVAVAVLGAWRLGAIAARRRLVPSPMAVRAALGVTAMALVVVLTTGTVRRNRDYHSDLAMWNDVAAKHPENPRAHDNLGTIHDAMGRREDAVRHYREALRLKPDYANARYNLGSVLIKMGRFEEGIAEYRETQRIDPLHPLVRISLGDALARQGRLDEGVAELRAVLRSDARNPLAWYFLGNALSELGRFDEALQSYREALRINPHYAEAHYSIGNAMLRQGRLEEAIAAYQESLRIDPRQASTHNNLGNALQRQNRLEEAVRAYQQAVDLNPGHANAHTNLGNILRQQGKLDEALAAYRAAVAANPGHATAFYGLGLVLEQQGKTADAIRALQESVRLNPGGTEAREALRAAMSRQGSGGG